MSRVGKHPIEIPAGVDVALNDGMLTGKGKNGEFKFRVHEGVETEIVEGKKVVFKPRDDSKKSRAMWGTCRAIVSKAIGGLSVPFTKKVNLVGVGYKASVQGKNLVMQLGYSHDIVFEIPGDVKIVCEAPTAIVVSGSDSQRVGEIVKKMQKFRSPEPYKGKGVIIEGQYVYRKEGKKK
ncbi:MAG: 50S ribosomal protein L6 [Holosporaceae bacterium]|jgi:large subunit ribosomal protein L6|nr:50S ribosomal protein L6 [Holosporaceae bacterium]